MRRWQHQGRGSAPKGAGEGQEGASAGLWSSRILQPQAGRWQHYEAVGQRVEAQAESSKGFSINPCLLSWNREVLPAQHRGQGPLTGPAASWASAAHPMGLSEHAHES